MRHPEGRISKVVLKGVEPKSMVQLSMNGPFEWSTEERFRLRALTEVLKIKLREVLREDKGGVYGVGISGSPSKYPTEEYNIRIRFGCAPERVDELIDAVNLQMDSLAMEPVDADYIAKVKELFRRDRETNLKRNGWWVSQFRVAYANGEDPAEILSFDERVDDITADAVQAAATTYFARTNYTRLVLMPEEETQEE
jgi:zinc protease